MPPTEIVNNWRLLELDIIAALHKEGKHVAKNAEGEPCAVHVNIAQACSGPKSKRSACDRRSVG